MAPECSFLRLRTAACAAGNDFNGRAIDPGFLSSPVALTKMLFCGWAAGEVPAVSRSSASAICPDRVNARIAPVAPRKNDRLFIAEPSRFARRSRWGWSAAGPEDIATWLNTLQHFTYG